MIDGFFQSANLMLASTDGGRTVGAGTHGFLVQAEQDPIQNGEILHQGRSTVRIQHFRPTFNNILDRNQKLLEQKNKIVRMSQLDTQTGNIYKKY